MADIGQKSGRIRRKKITSIGHSALTRLKSKNKKRLFKKYRGQGK